MPTVVQEDGFSFIIHARELPFEPPHVHVRFGDNEVRVELLGATFIMGTIVYVKGAERMLTAARLSAGGLYVRFADERDGVIPIPALELSDPPRGVSVPNPHVIHVQLVGGGNEEVPWDFARHWVDERYHDASTGAGARGRRLFAGRLRALRAQKGVTQQELARRASISRVSVARMEAGEQLPRYRTLAALAEALDVPIHRLLDGT